MLVIGSFTMLIAGCSPDGTSSPQAASGSLAPGKVAEGNSSKYDWVGKYHNDALSYALVRLRASKKISKLDRCKVGLAALKDFQKQYRKADGSSIKADPNLVDGMCEAAASKGFSLSSARTPLLDQGNISASAAGYMNDISSAVDYSANLPAYTFAVNKIENNAESALGTGSLETNAVFATGSLGISSEAYWLSNESSWSGGTVLPTSRLASPGTAPQYQVSSRTRTIIKADIGAAIGGLLYDWWMGEIAIEKALIKGAAASLIAGLSLLF
jgi:hypothetical protein